MDNSIQSCRQLQRTLDEKGAIFKRFFQGRPEVFNIDKTPYDQVSVDPKVKVKKQQWLNTDSTTGEWIPLTDDDIKRHITGEAPIAVFQKLVDDTVKFVTMDFDYPWDYEHVREVQEVVWKKMGVPCYIAKSSRKGWHLLFFFKEWTDFKLFTSFSAYVFQETGIDGKIMAEESGADGVFFKYPEIFPRPASYGDQNPKSLSCGSIKPPMVEPRMALDFNAFHKEFEVVPTRIEDQWEYLEKCQQMERVWFEKKLVELQIPIIDPNEWRRRELNEAADNKFGAELHDRKREPRGEFLKVLKGCAAIRENYEFQGDHSHPQRLVLGIVAANCKDGASHIMKLCETNPQYWQKAETEKAMKGLIGKYAPYTCGTIQKLGICKPGTHPCRGEKKDYCLEARKDNDGNDIPPSPYRFALAKDDAGELQNLKEQVRSLVQSIGDLAKQGKKSGDQEYDELLFKFHESIIDGLILCSKTEDKKLKATGLEFFISQPYLTKGKVKDLKAEAKTRAREEIKRALPQYERILDGLYEESEIGYVKHKFVEGSDETEQLTNFTVVFVEESEHRKNLSSNAPTEDRLLSGYIKMSDGTKISFNEVSIKLLESKQMTPLFEKLGVIAGPKLELNAKKIGEIRNCIYRFGYANRASTIKKTIVVEDHGWHGNLYLTSNALIDKEGVYFSDGEPLQIPGTKKYVKLSTTAWSALAFTVKQEGNAPRFSRLGEHEIRPLLTHYLSDFLPWHKPEVTYVVGGHSMASVVQKFFPRELQNFGPILYISGLFGKGKTDAARAGAYHYGKYRLMFNWQNSSRNLTDNLWLFRDALVWIDNYKKQFAPEAAVHKVVHLFYERHARGSQRQDGSARLAKPCAGFCIMTGEDVFNGDPATASRCTFINFNKYNRKSENQANFESVKTHLDQYSAIPPFLIQHALNLPDTYWQNTLEEGLKKFKPLTENYRENADRVLMNVSMVYLGFMLFLDMCKNRNHVIDEAGFAHHKETLENALSNVMGDTLEKIGSDSADANFLEDMRSLITGNPNKYFIDDFSLDPRNNVATRVGFVDSNGDICFFKDALKSLTKEFPGKTIQSIETIAQALYEQNHLAAVTDCLKPFAYRKFTDPDNKRTMQRTVLIVRRTSFLGDELFSMSIPGQEAPETIVERKADL